jgi:hypothetical protein
MMVVLPLADRGRRILSHAVMARPLAAINRNLA